MLIGARTRRGRARRSSPPTRCCSRAALVIILVLTPFQAAAEEYVFRGFLAQILGSWVRFAPVAIIVPTAIFAVGAHLRRRRPRERRDLRLRRRGRGVAHRRARGRHHLSRAQQHRRVPASWPPASTARRSTNRETASDAGEAAIVIVSTLIGTGDLGGLGPLAREAQGHRAARRPHPRRGVWSGRAPASLTFSIRCETRRSPPHDGRQPHPAADPRGSGCGMPATATSTELPEHREHAIMNRRLDEDLV